MSAMKKTTKALTPKKFLRWTKRLVGKTAYLSDFACSPGQVGCFVIAGPSQRGPEWCVAEEKPGGGGFSNPNEWSARTILLSKFESVYV